MFARKKLTNELYNFHMKIQYVVRIYAIKAKAPNPNRMEPDNLFNQTEDVALIFSLKNEAVKLRIIHHAADPIKTPKVVISAPLKPE